MLVPTGRPEYKYWAAAPNIYIKGGIMKYTGHKYDKRHRYVGHSLSFCVKDILAGVMPIKCVKAIHSGTRIRTLHEWRHVVKQYIHTYWSGYEFRHVNSILNKLLFGNRVFYQCRLNGKHKILRETWTKA